MGVLAILPLPPLDGGKLLFALAPRKMGWQRARYRLDDENWGLLILLVLSLPVIFRIPLVLRLLDKILEPLIRVLS
jgi:membrane-associated protease RseP (regulator of RpoE activity)